MKINEFIEKYKKQNLTQSIKSLLAVKNYLPYEEKKKFVDEILYKCKVINHGYVQIDEIKKYIVFTIGIIGTYTNLEFDKNFNVAVSEYDALCEAGVLNDIIGLFEGEYNTVLNMVNMRQDYILQENNIDYQVIKFLNGLSEKIDFALMSIADNFSSFSEMNITSEDINKLTNLISSLGK
jgi:hypothetical protein